METLYRRLQGRDFVMLAVSQDDEGIQAVKPFLEKSGYTFPVLLDPKGSVSSQYGVTGYPETFIIDRQGKVVQHVIGPENWQSDESYRYFLGLLQHKPAANPASAGQSAGGG